MRKLTILTAISFGIALFGNVFAQDSSIATSELFNPSLESSSSASLAQFSTGQSNYSSSMFEHSSEAQKEVGDFSLFAKGLYHNLLLGNNKFYQPVRLLDQLTANQWQISDTIRVIRTRKRHHYMLANLTTGGMVEAKIAYKVKNFIGDFAILARVENRNFLFGNNVFYKPVGSISRGIASSWDLFDRVRIFRIKHRHRRIAVNVTKREVIEVYVSNIESSQSTR